MEMDLLRANEGQEYIIRRIDTSDEELNAFLFWINPLLYP